MESRIEHGCDVHGGADPAITGRIRVIAAAKGVRAPRRLYRYTVDDNVDGEPSPGAPLDRAFSAKHYDNLGLLLGIESHEVLTVQGCAEIENVGEAIREDLISRVGDRVDAAELKR